MNDPWRDARALFAEPGDWPGLLPRRAWRLVHLQQEPTFTPWAAWCVLQERPGTTWVRRLVWQPEQGDFGQGATSYATEAPADPGVLTGLLQGFDADVRIAGFPSGDDGFGLDGTRFQVRVWRQGLEAELVLRWWSEPPEAWHGLEAYFQRARTVLDSGLPACTIHIG